MIRAAFFSLVCLFAASSEAAIIENADGLEDVIASGHAAAVLWVSKDREGQEDLHKLVDLAEEQLDGRLKVRTLALRTLRASSNLALPRRWPPSPPSPHLQIYWLEITSAVNGAGTSSAFEFNIRRKKTPKFMVMGQRSRTPTAMMPLPCADLTEECATMVADQLLMQCEDNPQDQDGSFQKLTLTLGRGGDEL